jgi:hypothetical protein
VAACADRAHHLTSSRHARRSSPGNPDSNAPTWQVGNVADHLTRTQVRPNMVLHPCLCGVPPGWRLRVRGGQVRTRWVISARTTSAPADRFSPMLLLPTQWRSLTCPPHNLSIRPVFTSRSSESRYEFNVFFACAEPSVDAMSDYLGTDKKDDDGPADVDLLSAAKLSVRLHYHVPPPAIPVARGARCAAGAQPA